MAKSKIIRDLVSGECGLDVAMKRLYVILNDLNDKDLTCWIKQEINGYDDVNLLPEYRKIFGSITGSYTLRGNGHIATYNNVALPTIKLDEETIKNISSIKLHEGIKVLLGLLETIKGGKAMTFSIPMQWWSIFQQGTNISITNAYVNLGEVELSSVIEKMESKVLDIMLLLEKKFGNLDELDIDSENVSQKDLKSAVNSCKEIIFDNCNFINMEKAKVKGSNIGSGKNLTDKDTNINMQINTTVNKENKGILSKVSKLSKLFKK